MSVYLMRTNTGELASSLRHVLDTAFVNQRFDDAELSGARFEHCTFANVSFLNTRLDDCHFLNCVFEGCYFRKTRLTECHLPASRFIDCEFVKPRIFACGFQYTRFQRSAPRFIEVESSLPGEPNLCRELCHNLATEASVLGNENEARQYRLRAIREREEELRRGYRWSDSYSESHYPELERVRAFLELCVSRLNGWLWGHGEYLTRLLLNVVVLALIIGPILLYLARDHLHKGGSIGFGDCVVLSVASVLNTAATAGVGTTGVGVAIVLALSALGLLFLGLFVTYVFRAVTRR
jgi:hypothetical protein